MGAMGKDGSTLQKCVLRTVHAKVRNYCVTPKACCPARGSWRSGGGVVPIRLQPGCRCHERPRSDRTHEKAIHQAREASKACCRLSSAGQMARCQAET